MTQGDPVSPTLFHILVKTVVSLVLLELYVLQEAQNGLGWEAGKQEIMFYADDGHIVGQTHNWVQNKLPALVPMFERASLYKNLGNTNVMVCTPGFIWGQQGEAA